MEKESDEGLFTYLAFLETDKKEADLALKELMRRYEAILRARCNQFCAKFPSLGFEPDELTNQTFWKAVQGASTYKALNPDFTQVEQIRYTSSWLFKIAQNIQFDEFRKLRRPKPYERITEIPPEVSIEDLACWIVDTNPGLYTSADRFRIADAIGSMKEDWRMVVVWTLDKRQGSYTGNYMNRGSATDLAARLNTTPANVRQMRRRAYQKIKASVLDVKAKKK